MAHFPMPFVVGLGRSGTTLLRMMLDAYEELAIPPEQGFIPRVSDLEAKKNPRRAFLRIVTGRLAWNDCGILVEDFETELEKMSSFSIPDGIRCFYRLYADRFDKSRYEDKTPPYRSHMRTIEGLLPEARFVHLIRDGRDVALSRRGLWFEKEESIEGLASRWDQTVRATREHGRTVSHYMESHYEDLVFDPEATLKKICRFVELDYDPGMLRYHEGASERLGELKTRYNPDGSIRVSADQQRAVLEGTTRPPTRPRSAGDENRWTGGKSPSSSGWPDLCYEISVTPLDRPEGRGRDLRRCAATAGAQRRRRSPASLRKASG